MILNEGIENPPGSLGHDKGARRSRPWMMSFLLHGLLGSLLLFWLTQSPADRTAAVDRAGGIVLIQRTDRDREKEYLDASEWADTTDFAHSPDGDVSDQAPPPLSQASLKRPELAGAGLPASDFDANSMSAALARGLESVQPSDSAESAIVAADRALLANRRPAGPATSIQVFGGGKLSGRSFLFLLDRSKSMGAGGLGVIQAARQELASAIGQLDDHHQFQVIGYHERTTPMKQRSLLSADDAHQAAVAPFIASLAAYGATNHFNAITVATTYDPDVIVVLTDGGPPELNQAQFKEIRRLAGSTQIHCIEFGFGKQQQASTFLVQLAEQNAGTYRYVNVQEWKQD